ncbi:MAG: cobalamin biosynthesis protein, partial [Streptosporangiaceae bacterium]
MTVAGRATASDPVDPSPPGWPLASGLVFGILADALAGDPARAHPVALFGRAATGLERRLYA